MRPSLLLISFTLAILYGGIVLARIVDEAIENDLINRDIEKEINEANRNDHLHDDSNSGGDDHEDDDDNDGNEDDNDRTPVNVDINPEQVGQSNESGSSSYVIRMLTKAFRFLNLKKLVKNVQQGRSSPGACITCKFAMTMVKYLIDYGKGFEDVAYVTSYFCKTLNVQTPRVCEGYVNSFMEEFVVVMSKVDMSANEICGTLLGESCSPVMDTLHNWTLPLPKSPRLKKSLFLRPFNLRWPFGGPRQARHFKVLQISDIHLDPQYAEGSNAVCGEPLCCRSSSPGSNDPLTPDKKAGYWGDYRDCDIPLHTVEETFRFIRYNHPDIDYVIWTGDIPPHDIWNQTKESQIELINVVGNLLDEYFGHIPIYPVVGNHESLPMNSFPQPSANIDGKYSKNWLYDKLAEHWLRWLPIETQWTIERGAFFATRAKSGLKIISLNTNFCNNQNWWILLNSTDPGHQLEWLIRQLTESEELGEMVQILGHVPPGSNDCIQMWSRNYNRIINRFAHIIKGQFFGHTHNDEFEIFYDEVSPHNNQNYAYESSYKATNVAYIGPSITTFGNVNPGYRIYLIDQDTFDIVDHYTYYMNLTESNAYRNSRPIQYRESYSAREAYGMKNLSPNEWHKMVMRMRTPIRRENRVGNKVEQADQLFKQFHRFVYNLSDNIGEENKCDDEACKYELLCRLLTALSHDTTICRHFLL